MSAGNIEIGLRRVRRRRWFLWSLVLAYLPVIWTTLEVTGSDRKTGLVFVVWALLLFWAALAAALVRCPRCGNGYHLNGVVPLYLRHCVHCGLPLSGEPN
ncbi:hypothetical protein JCM30471_35360 [Desulfuromonas carbonis]